VIVEGVMIPDATCSCGARLRAVPNWDGSDWLWVDEDGHQLVDRSPDGYRDDPKGWWERLARENIAAYSDLSAREALGMLGWTHGHRPVKQDPWTGGDVPRCCDMPMRLTPRGWVCRERVHEGLDARS
jgi:hypothetical protein